MAGLTKKQRVFIEEYLRCWNATEAARRAGYKGSDNTLGAVGSENLKKPKIAEQIEEHIQQRIMAADECLMRLGDMARADITDFLDNSGRVDLQKAAGAGKTHLIKKLRTFRNGKVEIELHDSLAALEKVGRALGLFVDRHIVEIDWREITIQYIVAGDIDYDALSREFGKSLADELFEQAGVQRIQSGDDRED